MFKIKTTPKSLTQVKADGILIGLFQGEKLSPAIKELDSKTGQAISRLIKDGEIKAKFKEFTIIRTEKLPTSKILVIGLGKKSEFDLDKIRGIAAKGARTFRRIGVKSLVMCPNEFGVAHEDFACATIEGMMMGLHRYKKWVTSEKKKDQVVVKTVTLIASDKKELVAVKKGISRGKIYAEGNMFCRDLVNEPGSTMTPKIFIDTLKKAAKGLKNLKLSVLSEQEMKKLGMEALLAVGRGSVNRPQLLVMKYSGGGKGDKKFGLVGKGVTFDTGGYDLKPGGSIYRMYSDMAGAAAVCSSMVALAKMGLKKNVVAVAGLVENRIDGQAYLTGDILNSMNGKTIEVLNTDAEGRLVLADCLTYIQRKEKVDEVIDVATLTGSMVMALGHFVTGAFTNNEKLLKGLYTAGEQTNERLWQLPLYSDYLMQIKSDVADLENVGGRPAGSITAAMFLKQFVENDLPWVHLDIAGTAFMEESIYPYAKKTYYPKEGATGIGTRLFLNYLENSR